MKVVIEIDLPDGQAFPDPRDIVRLTSPDWHCDWWSYEDVQGGNPDLDDDEARRVLEIMNHKKDCNVGINWDSIDVWADWVRQERPPSICECCHEEFDREDLEKINGMMICGECESDMVHPSFDPVLKNEA